MSELKLEPVKRGLFSKTNLPKEQEDSDTGQGMQLALARAVQVDGKKNVSGSNITSSRSGEDQSSVSTVDLLRSRHKAKHAEGMPALKRGDKAKKWGDELSSKERREQFLKRGTSVLKKYGISYDGVFDIRYRHNSPRAMVTEPDPFGRGPMVFVGPKAMAVSDGEMGSMFAHELEVHVKKQLLAGKESWTKDPQGVAMMEIEAYDHELHPDNQKRFGYSDSYRAEIQSLRDYFYNQLNDANKERVDRGDFSDYTK